MANSRKRYSELKGFLRTPTPTLIGIYILMIIIFTIADRNFLTIQNFKGIFNNFVFLE